MFSLGQVCACFYRQSCGHHVPSNGSVKWWHASLVQVQSRDCDQRSSVTLVSWRSVQSTFHCGRYGHPNISIRIVSNIPLTEVWRASLRASSNCCRLRNEPQKRSLKPVKVSCRFACQRYRLALS